MNQKAGRNAVRRSRKHEQESGNHLERIYPAAAICKGIWNRHSERVRIPWSYLTQFCRILRRRVARRRMTTNYLAAASALFSRALRRFAAFAWMIPRLAALSIAETSARTCSGRGVCPERTVFCIVRRRVATLRLRSDRFMVWRARLAADLVLAIK